LINKIEFINKYYNLPFETKQILDIYDIIILLETVRKKYKDFKFNSGPNRTNEIIFVIDYCTEDNIYKQAIGYGNTLKAQIYDALYKIVVLEKEK